MTEVPQVPSEAGEGKGADKEGLYTIDNPLRVMTCTRCWRAVHYKNNRLYCPTCKKFRTTKTSQWINRFSNIRFVTKKQLDDVRRLRLK